MSTEFPAQLMRCLRLNALALAFSLAHTIVDISIFASGPELSEAAATAIVAVACAVYGWWGWSMAQAAQGRRSALMSLLALCGIWAVNHGASFVFTPLTEYVAEVIHFGSLIFGVCHLARAARQPGGRRDSPPVEAGAVMVQSGSRMTPRRACHRAVKRGDPGQSSVHGGHHGAQ